MTRAADATGRGGLIGVFDSGVGGLSILRALRERLPGAAMLYVGDTAHAPYGARSADAVVARSQRIVEWLVAEHASLIVVACNTATLLAIQTLRARWPTLEFVGTEPGIKPAAGRSRHVAIMTTVATSRSPRLHGLIERHGNGAAVHVEACPELAGAIERGCLGGPALAALLRPHAQAIRAAGADTVVLGCTHYALVEGAIREALGSGVQVIDTAAPIADRASMLWRQAEPMQPPTPGLRICGTGAIDTLQHLVSNCAGLAGTVVEVCEI